MTSKASSQNSHDQRNDEMQQPGHQGARADLTEDGNIIENRIYVGGVPTKMSEPELFSYFSKFGEVDNAIIIDKSTAYNTNRYGFITFKAGSAGAVRKLLFHTDPATLTIPGGNGRTLTVGPAKQRSNNRPRHWGAGGREDRGQQPPEYRRRYTHHHQSWGRRNNERSQAEDRLQQGAFFRRKDVRSVSEGDSKGSTSEVPLEIQIPPQDVVVEQQIPETYHHVPAEMMYHQQQMMSMCMGYEHPPVHPTNTMYPGAYPTHMQPAYYGTYGFYDYSCSEQMMVMAQGGAYYNQLGPYPDLYSQQYNTYPEQYLQNYYLQQPQPLDYSMSGYIQPQLQDSGFLELSGQSLGGQGAQPQYTESSNLGGSRESEVEDSPVLNMSHAISGKEGGRGLANGHLPSENRRSRTQQEAQADHGSAGRVRATRPISTPYKQFHPFNGGYPDPQGNRFPFKKHARKFQSVKILTPPRSDQGQEPAVIKEPPAEVKEEREARKSVVSDSSEQLHQVMQHKLVIK